LAWASCLGRIKWLGANPGSYSVPLIISCINNNIWHSYFHIDIWLIKLRLLNKSKGNYLWLFCNNTIRFFVSVNSPRSQLINTYCIGAFDKNHRKRRKEEKELKNTTCDIFLCILSNIEVYKANYQFQKFCRQACQCCKQKLNCYESDFMHSHVLLLPWTSDFSVSRLYDLIF
jgi:hypothetical protein